MTTAARPLPILIVKVTTLESQGDSICITIGALIIWSLSMNFSVEIGVRRIFGDALECLKL